MWLADAFFGDMERMPKQVVSQSTGRVYGGAYYRGVCPVRRRPVRIDLTIASDLESAFVHPDYYDRNFFHEL